VTQTAHGEPAAASLSDAARSRIAAIRDRYPHPRSAILPALWEVHHELGHLSPEGMTAVAEVLGLTRGDVEAVATFYSMYFQKPHGRHEVLVCINVSCALRGADGIVDHLERSLGCPSGSTTADGAFTWSSTVECLGACGGAPAMQVDHHFHENLTPERVDSVLGRIRESDAAGGAEAGAVPPPGEGLSGAMLTEAPREKHQRRRGGKGPR